MSHQLKAFSLFLLFCLGTSSLFAQLNVVPARQNANYQVGETITFNVTTDRNGQANYVLKYDNYSPVLETGEVFLIRGQTRTIQYTLTQPGVVFCFVSQNGVTARAAAAAAPLEIDELEAEPADFDAFWNNQKAQLNSVPINPQITPFSSTAYSTTYQMRLGHIDGRRIYGYVSVPNGPGPFPGFITYPSFGNTPGLVQPEWAIAERGGAISISLSIHNARPDQTDPNGYQPDVITDRDQIYYRYAVLAGVRAIDYLFSRPDFDGSNVGVVGVSQGGGLAVLLAGIDQRVNVLAYSNSSHCQHTGLKYNQASGFPFYVHAVRSGGGSSQEEAQAVSASKYYDCIHAAKRFNGPVLLSTSYEDETAPAATQFAASNQFSGPKVLVNYIDGGHAQNPEEYWTGRYDFFRRHIPSMQNPPWPFAPSTIGFLANAGSDRTISSSSVSLTGRIEREGQVNPPLPVRWRKVSGPGNVTFSNAFNRNTNATFSTSGTYVLSFSATDEALLASDTKFYTISDQVVINVGSGGDNIRPTLNLSTASNQVNGPFVVTAGFSEPVTGLRLNDFTVSNGSISSLTGNGAAYTFTISPTNSGVVSIALPANRVQDGAGNNNTASNTLSVNYSTGGGGGSVDLELAMDADKSTFSKFDNITFSLTLTNDGTATANNIRVAMPLVNGSAYVSHTATSGDYINWSGHWDISSLAAGSSATLELTVFTLNDDGPLSYFAEVLTASPDDVDSSPGNANGSTVVEDDEAKKTIDPQSGGGDTTPPSVNLSTPSTSVTGPFVVTAIFSETVSGVNGNDFVVNNGTLSGFSGGGVSYNFTVTPSAAGNVVVNLPQNRANDAAGNGNIASTNLTVIYSTNTGGGGGELPDGYCNSSSGQPWQEWIGNVRFGSINKTSLKSQYSDFTDEVAAVTKGSSYTIRVQPSFSYQQWDEYIRVWIDFNRDGDFNDSGERVFSAIYQEGVGGSTANPVTGSIQIPTTARDGKTRMRVSMKRGSYAGYCSSIAYGEIEDYAIEIGGNGGGGGDTTPPSVSLATASTAVSAAFTVNLNFSESISGLSNGDLAVTNGSASGLSGSGNSYSVVITPTADGAVTVRLPSGRVNDAAANGNTASNTLNVTYTAPTGGNPDPPTDYCAARATEPWQEWIGNVTFAGINFDSWKLPTGYADFTSEIGQVAQGGVYNISLRPGFSGQRFEENWRVWIDYNRDGDFNDSGERVFSGVGAATVGGAIAIPASAETGQTRMRVSMQRGSYADYCGNSAKGEVEDYLINVNAVGTGFSLAQQALLTFQATAQNWKVDLEWLTNTSYKNAYFEVERSADGEDFEVIATIENTHQGSQLYRYEYEDVSPLIGTNYYRIRQVFEDDTFVYTHARKLFFDQAASLLIYPNPSSGQLWVPLQAYAGEKALLQIVDPLGRVLLEQSYKQLPGGVKQLDLNQLESGIYWLMLKVEGKAINSQRFILNRL